MMEVFGTHSIHLVSLMFSKCFPLRGNLISIHQMYSQMLSLVNVPSYYYSTFFTVHPVNRVEGGVDGVGELELGELDAALDDVLQVHPLAHVGGSHDVHGRKGGIHPPKDALHHQLHPQLVIYIILLLMKKRGSGTEQRVNVGVVRDIMTCNER